MTRRTGYVWHERYAWHDTGTHVGIYPSGGMSQPYHAFESSQSKSRIAGLIEVSGMLDELTRVSARPATRDELLRVHTAAHVDRIRRESDGTGGDGGDGTTPFGPGSFEIAALAAGGTIAATDEVLAGAADNAYALVRPPGHHAVAETGMGYCLFNNVAVAIEHARATYGTKRVAIVDYDVHHGNGAQSIYWDDPNVLTISLHQERLFPQDSGDVGETGGPGAVGSCINVPLPAGSGNGAYLAAIDRVVAPAIAAFDPELIMVCSGFDASPLDPLGCMTVGSEGFGRIAARLVEIADEVCDGHLVFTHEGGYSPVHAPFCALAVLEALSGRPTGVVDPFAVGFEHSPAHALRPWQDDAIARAEEVVRALGVD
jgi:acetoin utilization deacetylase AcuC-like enzyme